MKKALKQSTLVLILNGISIGLLTLILLMTIFIGVENTKISDANQDRVDLNSNATRFLNGSGYLTDEVRAYAVSSDKAHYNNYWNEVNTAKNRDIGIQNMKDIGITSEEEKMINEMLALSNKLVPLEEEAMNFVGSGNLAAARQAVYGEEYVAGLGEISALQTKFLSTIESRTQEEITNMNTIIGVVEVFNCIFVVVIIVFQLFNYLIIRKKIVAPVIEIQHMMGEFAEGHLDTELKIEADTSEIGMLAHSIKQMQHSLTAMVEDLKSGLGEVAKGNFNVRPTADFKGDFIALRNSLATIIISLSETLSQINEASSQVSSGAGQVSAGAQALSQGTTEQASAVQELAATITEILEQVKKSAGNAQVAKNEATQAGNEIMGSNEQMTQMIEAISQISLKSSEIGKIIKTIDDIAFQTNILALNAAVEAARAGVAGKGFAVVADEVRSLASKSAEAAKDTTSLIEETIKAVENGTKIANATATSMMHVVAEAQQVTVLVDEIAQASNSQAGSISQVTQGVEQISAVVQTNSATAEESAAASEELAGQADLLKDLVDTFKLLSPEAIKQFKSMLS